MVCFDPSKFVENLHKPDFEDTILQESLQIQADREQHDAVLKKAEMRETEEEFTKLCIEKLGRASHMERLLAAQQRHLLSLRHAEQESPYADQYKEKDRKKRQLFLHNYHNKDIRQQFVKQLEARPPDQYSLKAQANPFAIQDTHAHGFRYEYIKPRRPPRDPQLVSRMKVPSSHASRYKTSMGQHLRGERTGLTVKSTATKVSTHSN